MYAIVYEGVRGFAIATTRVTDGTLRYWPDKKPLYKPGPMKDAPSWQPLQRCGRMISWRMRWSLN